MSTRWAAFPAEHIDSSISIDTLTGLGNIFALLQAAKVGLQEAMAQPGTLLALVLTQIDDFAAISIQIGDEAADELLKGVATTLYSILKEKHGLHLQGTLYRVGKDEFALLVQHSSCQDLRNLVAELQQSVNNLSWPGLAGRVTLCTSGACFPSCAVSLGHLIAYTNLFLKKSQESGAKFACPGSPEHQDAQFLSVELHNNATAVIESFSERILNTAVQLSEAKKMAFTDPVTQLPNQRAARDMLQRMLREAKREKTSLCLMLVDGDNLADYNQRFGYAAGNDMIYWLGQHIKQLAPPNSFVARWMCGDEFLIFVPDCPRDECLELADSLRQHIQTESQELLIPITVSIGIASHPENGTSTAQLLEAIEAATKCAKANGRNRVCAY
ncbi:MAG: diguanylate cyclase [Firmicutes bacterium]|nr:diguanylate cyclase [Bacillota bacterium]